MSGILPFIEHHIIFFLVLLSILIFFHELGHYLAARLMGVRVLVFSIGFGRELLGFTSTSGTRFRLSLIPLGGYVKMHGDMVNTEGGLMPYSFLFVSPLRRMLIVFAGPFFNILVAMVVFAFIPMVFGVYKPLPVIGFVAANSAASAAGLKIGDRILSIDSQPVHYFSDISYFISHRSHDVVSLLIIDSKGQEHTSRVPIGFIDGKPRLGIAPSDMQALVRLGFWDSCIYAFQTTSHILQQMLLFLRQLVVGLVPLDSLAGPVTMAQLSAGASQAGFHSWLFFLAVISLNLAVMNALPIPGLDGGHFVLYLLEYIFPKAPHRRLQYWLLTLGTIFLMLLMGFIIFFDLLKVLFPQ